MHSLTRACFISFRAAALATLLVLDVNSICMVAGSPLPKPSSLSTADYSFKRFAMVHNSSDTPYMKTTHKVYPTKPAYTKRAYPSDHSQNSISKFKSRSENSANQIQSDLVFLTMWATNFKDIASRSTSVPKGDSNFETQCASELADFQTKFNTLGLAADLVLNDCTILKDYINVIKDILNSLAILSFNLSDSVLYPVIYSLKCVLDGILDEVEVVCTALNVGV